MRELDVAEEGFYARAAADLDLRNLIGLDETATLRLYPGAPTDTEEASDFPRATYFGLESPLAVGVGKVRIQLDILVWPQATAAFDPDLRLGEIDARFVELFDRQWWEHDSRRLSAHRLGGRPWPSRAGRPLRRTREFEILVS